MWVECHSQRKSWGGWHNSEAVLLTSYEQASLQSFKVGIDIAQVLSTA